ncbi:PE family protein [Mycobacterium tuberculosis]|uniref:PE family protein n=1 Tax=Mycobacterium tuberculosis TaxID=1773 RepID=UPI0032B3F0D0
MRRQRVIAAAATWIWPVSDRASARQTQPRRPTPRHGIAAGADEVSTAIAALFGAHGQAYQALSAQAQAFHAQFVQALTSGGGAYAAAEAAAVSPLLDPINEFFLANTGRPLIGNGANGAPGTGANGGDGGWLIGNSGAGGSGAAGVNGGAGGAAAPAGSSATAAPAALAGSPAVGSAGPAEPSATPCCSAPAAPAAPAAA